MVFIPLFYTEIREYFKACGSLAAVLFYVFVEPANNKLPKPGITLLPSEDIHRKSSLFTFSHVSQGYQFKRCVRSVPGVDPSY